MNRMASLLLFLSTFLGLPANAQELGHVERTWLSFERRCHEFLSDRQGFVDSLPVPGPAGERVIATSADGSSFFVETILDEVLFSVEIFVVGDRMDISCGSQTHYHPNLSAEDIEAEFRSKVLQGRSFTITGGYTDRDSVSPPPNMSASKYEPTYIYNAIGVFDGFDTITTVSFGQGYFVAVVGQTIRN